MLRGQTFTLLLVLDVVLTHSGFIGVPPHHRYKVLTFEPDLPILPRSSGKVLSCYYNVPTMYDRPFPIFPEQIDPFLCTHINVAFARVSNSTLLPGEDRDVEFYNRTVKLKEKNPQLKVLISVGGAGENSNSFCTMMATNATRKRFIASALAFMETYGFDGIDIDWEFPGSTSRIHVTGDDQAKEKTEFSAFFQEFRKEAKNFQKLNDEEDYILTAAVGALKKTVDTAYDIPELAKSLDYVNLMTYDFHYYGVDTPFTGPNSPLNATSTEYGYLGTMNTQWAATYWMQRGMPRDKIVLGVPTYGRTYRLVDAKYHDYFDLASGMSTSVGANGYTSYPEACKFLLQNGTTQIFNSETRESYAFNERDWISLSNEQSAIEKAQFANSMGFLGVSVYNLNSDDAWKLCHGSDSTFPISRAARVTLQI